MRPVEEYMKNEITYNYNDDDGCSDHASLSVMIIQRCGVAWLKFSANLRFA